MTSSKIFAIIIAVLLASFLVIKMNDQTDKKSNINENLTSGVGIDQISHASMILHWNQANLYFDPVGAGLYEGKPAPDIIFLTDIHGDHFDAEALKRTVKENTIIVAPQAVLDILPAEMKTKTRMMQNGGELDLLGFSIEAVPMYNLPESDKSFHPKGRGNGYVLEKDGTRVYISGDTSGIPEMRNLRDIDIAFVAMNLPYTMGVEEAADAVLAFKPKKVYPYHYRTPNGFSDVAKFKELVNAENSAIEVVQLDWYLSASS